MTQESRAKTSGTSDGRVNASTARSVEPALGLEEAMSCLSVKAGERLNLSRERARLQSISFAHLQAVERMSRRRR